MGGETVSLSRIPLWSVSGLCFVVVSSLSQSKWQRKAGGVKGIKFSDEAPDNNVRSVADPSPLQEKEVKGTLSYVSAMIRNIS